MRGLYQISLAGMNPPNRPVGTMLFLGPTGSGKTRVVEAAAEVLFGDPNAAIKIDCAEIQNSHEIAKLIGSAPADASSFSAAGEIGRAAGRGSASISAAAVSS